MSRNSKRENENFCKARKKGNQNLNSQIIITFNGKIQFTKYSKQSILNR